MAVAYLLHTDDTNDDFSAIDGLDDDAEVIIALCQALDRRDLSSPSASTFTDELSDRPRWLQGRDSRRGMALRRCVAMPSGDFEVHVTGTSELVRGHQAVFLSALDQIQELRPESTILTNDTSPGYRKAKLYLDALLKRTPPTDAALSIAPQAAINPASYQLEPAEMVFGLGRYRARGPQMRPRLLIADAVGLGKTIEVGILVTELIKRGRGDRILCLAKKSMLAQFQQELWARFNIPLVRLDSLGIARLRTRIPANRNPFSCYNRIVISIDTLKDTKASTSYRHYLESFPWDIVIIDEAHNCANPGTANNTLAHRVCANAEAVILATATPHNGKPRSFAELIRLLDPTAIADLESYEASDIAPYFIRRFKKDVVEQVGEHFRDREIRAIRSAALPAEEAIFARLGELRLRSINDQRFGQDHLMRWVLFKAYLSSPVAATETLAHRLTELRRRHASGKHDYLAAHIAELDALHADLSQQPITATARYAAMLDLLQELHWSGSAGSPRIILFTESRRTQDALAAALRARYKADDSVIQTIDGSMSDVDQSRIVDDFGKGDTPVRLLIATDVASEGVNLHYHCHVLIHYDLPWSLIRLEQRNGRIDRYGQTQNPRVHYLLTISACPAFTGDQRILDALIEKEQWVYRNTGDAAGVMQFHSVEDEESTIGEGAARGLTPDQILAAPDTPEAQQALLLERLLTAAQRLDATATPPSTSGSSTWPSLFPNDLAFLAEAWATVLPEVPLDRHPDRPQVEVKAPDDLWSRVGGSLRGRDTIIPGATAIPDEALPSDRSFVLTTDRAAVMEAIHRARVLAGVVATGPKKRGRPAKGSPAAAEVAVPIDDIIALAPELRSSWPRLHLLWEQHPVAQWLLDQVLIHFGRGEAPLLHAPHLPPRTAYTFMRGSIPNGNGRETVVDWFAIRFQVESILPPQEFAGLDIVPLSQALADVHLDRIGPTGREADVAKAIGAWLPYCVNTAQQHLSRLRASRGQALSRPLIDRTHRLQAWAAKARGLIDHKQERLEPASPSYKAHVGRLNLDRARIDRLLKSQQEWLKRTMRTSDTGVLQVALAVVGPGVTV